MGSFPIHLPETCPDCNAELKFYRIEEKKHTHVSFGTRNESATYACNNTLEYIKNFYKDNIRNNGKCNRTQEATEAQNEIKKIKENFRKYLKSASKNKFVQEYVEKITREIE